MIGLIDCIIHRSLKPLYVALVDPDSTENLRQNREKLSQDITELINEYAPKVFSDFDPNNVFRSDPSGNKESVSELAEGGRTFSQIASGFLKNAALREWLDDSNIFNWSRQQDQEEEHDGDMDVLHFLDKHSATFSSASEPESSLGAVAPRRRRSQKRRRTTAALTEIEKKTN